MQRHRDVLCRLNLHHTWRTVSTEDGSRYQRCARCGKDESGRFVGPLRAPMLV